MANKNVNTEQNNIENEELKRLQAELEKVNKEKEELNQKNKDLEEQIKKDTTTKEKNVKDDTKGKEKTYIVYTPVKNFNGIVAGVQFAYGKAQVKEGWVLNWFKEKGYKVEEIK